MAEVSQVLYPTDDPSCGGKRREDMKNGCSMDWDEFLYLGVKTRTLGIYTKKPTNVPF